MPEEQPEIHSRHTDFGVVDELLGSAPDVTSPLVVSANARHRTRNLPW